MKNTSLSSPVILAMIVTQFCLWSLLLFSLPYSGWGGVLFKIVVWGVPAFLYPRLIEGANPLEVLRLNRIPHGILIAASAGFLVLYIGFLHGGTVRVDRLSVSYLISAVVIAPVVEEIAFRGGIFQKLPLGWSFWGRNGVTAMLFLVYHIPLWFARGQSMSLMGCLWVVCFSLWMGYVLSSSRSLWTCISIHAIQNLIFGLV